MKKRTILVLVLIVCVLCASLVFSACTKFQTPFLIEDNTIVNLTDYGRTLENVRIPEGVTGISEKAFSEARLTSLYIPSSVIDIPSKVFADCVNLEKISIDSENTKYASDGNCIIEKDTNTVIAGCKNSVIPDYVTCIGDYAFYKCSKLSSVSIPDGVTRIGDYAFYCCYSLTNLEISMSLTQLGSYPFDLCYSLVIKYQGSELPSELSSQMRWSDEMSIPIILDCENNEIANDGYIYVVAGNGIQYALKDGFAKVSGHANLSGDIVIDSSIDYKNKTYLVTEIDDCSFISVNDIESVVIPNGVTIIGQETFALCINLTRIEVPSSVEQIGEFAFACCMNLTKIKIPISVKRMGKNVFFACEMTVYCEAEEQPSGWDSQWDNWTDYKLFVVEWGCKTN
ncbi:MAG: leucine-rich repeat domain-containing protein [Clostridia bacterium]|nr:leucine-rich repeat domain-containing protein [Clostridia bacterium]